MIGTSERAVLLIDFRSDAILEMAGHSGAVQRVRMLGDKIITASYTAIGVWDAEKEE